VKEEKSANTYTLSLWFLFFEVLHVYLNSLHPYFDIIKMHIHLVNKRDLEFKNKNCEEKMSTLSVVLYIYQNSLHPYYDIIKKKCKLLLWFFILKAKRMFCLYGRFVPPDVLSLRTFCLYGCFVPTDV
jgi:hypothetical protein